nr:transmembrane 9 superfamily member 4 [Quercus suber]
MTATLFPGLLFATIFILNLFVWAQASSTAMPLGTLIGLVFLWLLIQLPLVYAGSWYGFIRAGAYSHPIKATAVPRQIPQQAWYARNIQATLLAGSIPFAVMFIELLFVFRSLWQDKSGYYYVFGYLAVVSTILILAVVETTIIAVYIQLCSEVSARTAASRPSFPNRITDQFLLNRTTTGGGNLFFSAVAPASGSSLTAHTTISNTCISPAWSARYSSFRTVSWLVSSMACSRGRSGF